MLSFYRPRSVEVLHHCLFWSKATQLEFFQKVSDWIHESTVSTVKDDFEKGAGSVFIKNWKDSINEELKQGMTMLMTHSTINSTF